MNNSRTMKTKFMIQAAIIAAVYAVITIAFAPLSYSLIQVRISEALTVLPYFTPAAIPGLFVGAFMANLLSPYGLPDLILGSLASLIAATLSYKLRSKQYLVPMPPVIVNAVIIGFMLYFFYSFPFPLIVCMAIVGAGQLVACYGIGYPLMLLLKRYKKIFDLS